MLETNRDECRKAWTLSFWNCAKKMQSCDTHTSSGGGGEIQKDEVKIFWLRAANNLNKLAKYLWIQVNSGNH